MNCIDYLIQNRDSFFVRPPSPVDFLILSCAAYFPLSDALFFSPDKTHEPVSFGDLLSLVAPSDLVPSGWDAEKSVDLLLALAASPRFRSVQILDAVAQSDASIELQFAAVAFKLPNALSCIAFRGTDSTKNGWKEDFNMAFQSPIPAQILAADYLAQFSRRFHSAVVVCGHSKGGNLAHYASVMCAPQVRVRLRQAISFDGPGFLPEFLATARYQAAKNRLVKFVPQSSLVGTLLSGEETTFVIKSNADGIFQHNPYTWQVDGTDFHYLNTLTPTARLADRAIDALLSHLSLSERKILVDGAYELLTDSPFSSQTARAASQLPDNI